MTRRLLLISALLGVAAVGCGGDDDSGPALVADDGPRSTYTVTVAADDKGTDSMSWTLTCEPAGGTHPDAEAACAALAKAKDPFAPVAADAVCTEIYGGPAVATIAGTRDGTTVEARYTRTNGCEIARWDALGPVLPGPVPGQPGAEPS